MEQIQELLEILKSTPEMAMWGLAIYFLFILLKMASWIFALKSVISYFIKRHYDLKEDKAIEIKAFFQNSKVDSTHYGDLIMLLNEVKNGRGYIFSSDIQNAIKAIKESKK